VMVMCACLWAAGCRLTDALRNPSIRIEVIPQAAPGGPEQMSQIAGRVSGWRDGQNVVIYARSGGVWWVQPFTNRELTAIQADSRWSNTIHLGTDYAALLVEESYRPDPRVESLPGVGKGVLAVARVQGSGPPVVTKTIQFSGYSWVVTDVDSMRGGALNAYDPANAWVDEKGYLHLRTARRDAKVTCAEVALTRSLGYGTYRFVVEDTAHLDPDTMLEMYSWDQVRSGNSKDEMDFELGRWGIPARQNASFTVQPYYVPENVQLFTAPSGKLTHILRWEPGRATFKTVQEAGGMAKPVAEHSFTADVPAPAGETFHIILFNAHRCASCGLQPEEVVIEKFEYLP